MRFPKSHLLLAAAGHLSGLALICLVSGCGDAGTTGSAPADSIPTATGTEAATGALDSSAPQVGGFLDTNNVDSNLTANAASETQFVGREIWSTDFAAAKSQAASEGKDILMDFTGSDWCEWCIRLNDEVFRHAEFAQYAKENFVLLELDFPQDKSKLLAETMAQNSELQTRFGIQGFPTILLADAEGRPYAQTGYQQGGPEGFVKHLGELKGTRASRDEAITAAEQLEGVERAKKLDEALSSIPVNLVLPTYQTEVAQIVGLDEANEAGMRKRYQELQQEYQQRLVAGKFQQRIAEVQQFASSEKDVDATLKKLDEVESEFPGYVDGRITVNMIRIQLLNIGGRLDEIVKLTETVLADEEIQGEGRRRIYISKLGALEMSNRLEEGIEVIDAIGTEFPGDPNLSTRLLLTKVNYLAKLDRMDEGRETLKEARKLANSELMPEVDALEKQLFSVDANPGSDSPGSDSQTPAESDTGEQSAPAAEGAEEGNTGAEGNTDKTDQDGEAKADSPS